MKRIKTHSFLETVIVIYNAAGKLTTKEIERIQIVGTLLDDVFLLMHGSDQGTYLEVDEAFPEVRIDIPRFIAQFQRLSVEDQTERVIQPLISVYFKLFSTGRSQAAKKVEELLSQLNIQHLLPSMLESLANKRPT
ncbi:MAG: hypothetical protein HY069_01330 [Chlamydiia bacterium]|nr:hypothetical protein [Chlamydiia bacterium]